MKPSDVFSMTIPAPRPLSMTSQAWKTGILNPMTYMHPKNIRLVDMQQQQI